VESSHPRLSWRLESTTRNLRQSAYRIMVASSENTLRAGMGDLWDSGRVNSARTLGIPYEGRGLAPRQRCWWQVEVWTNQSSASAQSASSWWEMGLIELNEWTAEWLA